MLLKRHEYYLLYAIDVDDDDDDDDDVDYRVLEFEYIVSLVVEIVVVAMICFYEGDT